MSLKLREALPTDIEWINRRYDEVGFVHSNFDSEVIAVAEWRGCKAGLGRLVDLSGNNPGTGWHLLMLISQYQCPDPLSP